MRNCFSLCPLAMSRQELLLVASGCLEIGGSTMKRLTSQAAQQAGGRAAGEGIGSMVYVVRCSPTGTWLPVADRTSRELTIELLGPEIIALGVPSSLKFKSPNFTAFSPYLAAAFLSSEPGGSHAELCDGSAVCQRRLAVVVLLV